MSQNVNEKLFQQMEQQLRDYNDGKAEEPMFDETVFREFRDWQQERLAAQPFARDYCESRK